MADTAPPSPRADDLTDEQRRGRACWRCGNATGPLRSDGHAYMATGGTGAPLGFAIVACTSAEEAAR
ncbi:hypothetical protein OG871_10480 [Kitasatospora sp. NBC_00374]|uniref:hypothetical protein n=1 Tax=Kitasatospora sp. NBC_00374 TaxID=2975964 RepID=UPI0030E23B35